MTFTCFECQMQHPLHKMDCSSVSRMDTLQWLLNSLHFLPDELLDEVYGKVVNEVLERKFKDMFDDPMQELTELSQELGLYDEEGEQ